MIISEYPGKTIRKNGENNEHNACDDCAVNDAHFRILFASWYLIHAYTVAYKAACGKGHSCWNHNSEILDLHYDYLSVECLDSKVPCEQETNVQVPVP